jgi:Mg/Co/Ni transporter MgtE
MNPTAQLLEPEICELIGDGRYSELREALHHVPQADVADILAELGPDDAALAFRFLTRDQAGEVFGYLSPEFQEQLITKLGEEQSISVVENMSADDRPASSTSCRTRSPSGWSRRSAPSPARSRRPSWATRPGPSAAS